MSNLAHPGQDKMVVTLEDDTLKRIFIIDMWYFDSVPMGPVDNA